jgi:hypothetical protein
MALNPLDDPGYNPGRIYGTIVDSKTQKPVWNATAQIIQLGMSDNGMPAVRTSGTLTADSDDNGFFAIEFGWSRLSDNAVILESGILIPYALAIYTGSRLKEGWFHSFSQVDNGYASEHVNDQRLLCVPAFTSISTGMIEDWAKGDGGFLRKKVVDKLKDSDFFKKVKEAVNDHPLARLGGMRSNSMALIGAVDISMDPN